MSYGTVQAEKMTTESGYSLGAGNASSFKNRIINGDMVVSQRGTSFSGLSGANYTLDRWQYSSDASGGVATVAQSSDAPSGSGFVNSSLVTVTTARASMTGFNFYQFQQRIEGFNTADLGIGTASAAIVTISFWVKSSVTGTYSLAVNREAASTYRSYIATYTINSANTWEKKTITVQLDTSVSPVSAELTSGVGLYIGFQLATGPSYITSTLNTWQSGVFVAGTGQTNLFATNGSTWQLTGVQVEVGTVATSFDYLPYGTELALCQRYYQTTFAQGTAPANGASSGFEGGAFAFSTGTTWFQRYVFPVVMRAAPTIILFRGNEGTTDGTFASYDGSWTSYTSTLARQMSTQGVHIEGNRSGAFVARSVYLMSGNFTASAEL